MNGRLGMTSNLKFIESTTYNNSEPVITLNLLSLKRFKYWCRILYFGVKKRTAIWMQL